MPTRRDFLKSAAAGGAALPFVWRIPRRPGGLRRKPNLVLILADDAGYGDFGCYGAASIKTPHIDGIAAQGRRFTDAYAPNATCTPTRYSIFTGEYAWRRPGTGILPGDAALIIEPGRPTSRPSARRSSENFMPRSSPPGHPNQRVERRCLGRAILG